MRSICILNVVAGLDIVVVRIDEKRAIKRRSPDSGCAVVLRTAGEAKPMKFVDGALR